MNGSFETPSSTGTASTERVSDVAWNDPALLAIHVAKEAATRLLTSKVVPDEAARRAIPPDIADEMDRELGRVPHLSWMPNVLPDMNGDVAVSVSINGRLIHVARGDGFQEERYGINWTETDNLLGRILTLADAAFADPQQRKAFKDLTRQHLKGWMADIMVDAAADAGMARNIQTPFVGGVLEQDGGLYGVEGQPTT